MIRLIIIALVLLAGCRMPTEPTPAAVKVAYEPEQARVVSEVDMLPQAFKAPVAGQCDSGFVLVQVRAAWVRGTTIVSDTFLVNKCGLGI